MFRSKRRACAVGVCLLACVGVAGGEVGPAVRIAEQVGPVAGASLTIDGAGNPAAALVADERVYVMYGFDGFAEPRRIGGDEDPSPLRDMPAVATNPVGTTYLAFREQNGSALQAVGWTHNPGGPFRPPELIPESWREGVSQPDIHVAPDGGVFVGWSAEDDAGDPAVFIAVEGEAARAILAGADPDFDLGRDGTIHVAYVRDGDIFYSNDGGGDFASSEIRLTQTPGEETLLRLAVSRDGAALVLYRAGSSLYLTGGSWRHRELLTDDATSCRCVFLRATGDGTAYMAVFGEGGTLWRQAGLLGFASARSRVCDLTGREERVDIAADASSYLHLLFLRDGELYYANDAPAPRADFSVDRTEGEVPLEVAFRDDSEGHILHWYWEFGDGSTSLLRNPLHVYEEPGAYTVSLLTTGTAGVSDRIVRERAVVARRKSHHLIVPDMLVYAGQRGLRVPLKATNTLPVQGFQLAGRFDAGVVTLAPGDTYIDFEYTVSAAQSPEFVAASQDPAAGEFTVGVIYDASPPIVGKAVPPGTRMNLVNLVADISGVVANRTETFIRLEDGIGDPPISNIFTVQGGVSIYPEIRNGVITVIRPDIEFVGPTFLRGDANNDRSISIADSIFVLAYLFGGGPPPYCMDAADADDNAAVNIADAIALLSYLFAGNFSPAVPFPTPGLDPGPDDLPDCGES